MVRKSNSFFQKKVSNRLSYTIIAVFALLLIGVGVYALGAVPSPVGHSLTQLQPCSNGETLVTSGGVWTCSSGGSGGSQWITSGANISYNSGNVGIGMILPTEVKDVVDLAPGGRADTFLSIRNNKSGGTSAIQLFQEVSPDNSRAKFFITDGQAYGLWQEYSNNALPFVIGAASQEQFRITPEGNVGIGSQFPSSKLSVGGNGFPNTGIYGKGSSYGIYAQTEDGGTALKAVAPLNSGLAIQATGNVTVSGDLLIGLQHTTASCSSCSVLTVTCPAGTKILGGGCGGNVVSTSLRYSRPPSGSLTQWYCEWTGFASSVQSYFADAMCARISN